MFFVLLFSFILSSFAEDWSQSSEFLQWEKETLSKVVDPQKLYEQYLKASELLETHGANHKAKAYAKKAWSMSFNGDKTQSILKLVNYSINDIAELKKYTVIARQWFKKYPSFLNSETDEWLKLMESHANGETIVLKEGFYASWSLDARVSELMKEGKSQAAFDLIKDKNFSQSNINDKVRFDLLATLSAEKKELPSLLCLPLLKKRPSSITWTMRLCRYLENVRTQKKSSESIESISTQLQTEDPERLFWMEMVRKL